MDNQKNSPEFTQDRPPSSWENAVIYQIYPRSFAEARHDEAEFRGEGSLLGIASRLDYLKSLGVDAVWISPFYPSPMKDGGYDVMDHTDVDQRYGSLADFDHLVETAHERGIKVMVDFVPNHTSDQHAWFQESRSSSDNPKSDWYIWRDPRPDGSPPNNWASVFSLPQLERRRAGELDLPEGALTPPLSAWTFDEARGQYYLHSFAAEQPDLNWANPEVRQAQKQVMRFWLQRGVDGFRVDAVNHIGKDLSFEDEAPNPDYREGVDNPYDQLERYHSANFPEALYEYLHEITAVLDEPEFVGRDTHLMFEAYVPQEMIDRMNAIAPKRASAFNFSRLDAAWQAKVQEELIDKYYQHLLPEAVANQVNGNHDKPRLASRIGNRAARAAAVINATLPGQMFIYNGEEAGFRDVDVPAERRDDKLGLRDGARTPLPWNDGPSAGFSKADEDRLWLPLSPDYRQSNISSEIDNRQSSLWLYKRLLEIKHQSDTLRRGSYRPLVVDNSESLAFARRHDDDQLITLVNFASTSQTARIKGADQVVGVALLSSSRDIPNGGELVDLDRGIELQPFEAIIIANSR